MQSLEGIFVVEMERAQVRVLLPALLVLLTSRTTAKRGDCLGHATVMNCGLMFC